MTTRADRVRAAAQARLDTMVLGGSKGVIADAITAGIEAALGCEACNGTGSRGHAPCGECPKGRALATEDESPPAAIPGSGQAATEFAAKLGFPPVREKASRRSEKRL